MVVKNKRWPAWPPSPSRKLETFLAIRGVEGLPPSRNGGETARALAVEVQWKGQQKGLALSSLRRSAKKTRTQERFAGEDGVARFETDGEFRNVCGFAGPKEGLFYPWEIAFTVQNAVHKVSKNKASVLGTASLDLTEYASVSDGKEISVKIPINGPSYTPESHPSLDLLISFVEIRAGQEIPGSVTESATTSPLTSCYSGTPSPSKDEVSALKAGLRKVMSFTDFMSRKGKKTLSEEDGSDSGYPQDSDSPEESGPAMLIDRSVSYESLALANWAQGLNGGEESLIYYSHRRKSDASASQMENNPNPSIVEEVEKPSLKSRLLPWRKRKLNFGKSPKPKGEPLIKKHYGEEGGDDIDYDRRQLSGAGESSFGWNGLTPNRSSSISEFGDDGFVVGSWENKEVTSRDGLMKLQTQVFFSAIDQRSERAAGESACTALVAVISNWLQRNVHEMPVRSEFDDLIRDGSSEWRNLCDNSEYIAQFPDKHFDLETVLQAQVRPLAVVPEKSFIGFFRPEGLQEGELDFLHGAMSFDNIWDEISKSASELPSGNGVPTVYIISWNDHFFVLKVESDAYYIIDTLGERLFEGCNQAYVLKFDKDTEIQRVPQKEDKKSDSKETKAEANGGEKEAEVVCVGKECCREYIKSFLAAIPLRELQVDLSKGKMASTPIHHRLQIEFHYTVPEKDVTEAPVKDSGAVISPMALAVA